MTWNIHDIALPATPQDSPFNTHSYAPSESMPSMIALPPPLEGAEDWLLHSSPADRELYQQNGLLLGEQWDMWRHIATRGIDAIQ